MLMAPKAPGLGHPDALGSGYDSFICARVHEPSFRNPPTRQTGAAGATRA